MSAPKTSKLAFFRLVTPPWWEKEETLHLLERAFNIPVEAQAAVYRNTQWATGNFRALDSGRWVFKLGRIKDNEKHETISEADGHFRFTEIDDGPVAGTVRCLFDPDHKLLVAEQNSQASVFQVQGSIKALIDGSQRAIGPAPGSVQINPIFAPSSLRDWASRVEKVTLLSANIEPTNPVRLGRRELDEGLKEAGVTRAKIKLENPNKGIDIDADLGKALQGQVNAGYGTLFARGISNGMVRVWNSTRTFLHRVIPWTNDDDELEETWLRAARDAEKEAGVVSESLDEEE